MFILTRDGKEFINYNNIINLKMIKAYHQYHHPDTWWEIIAVYSGGYIVVDKYYSEQECKNAYSKLCNKIAKSRGHEIIDMSDL